MRTPASPERKRYRGAVIGAGGIARQSHLPALREAAALRGRVEVVALVDSAANVPPVDAIPLLARREQLRDLAPLDFIDICTPTASHLELTLWGLEQGYHVVCEKPVALTRGEADRIAAAARTSGRIVMPCHQYRHNPVWMKVKEWLGSVRARSSGSTTRRSSRRRHITAGSRSCSRDSWRRSTAVTQARRRDPSSRTSGGWRASSNMRTSLPGTEPR